MLSLIYLFPFALLINYLSLMYVYMYMCTNKFIEVYAWKLI